MYLVTHEYDAGDMAWNDPVLGVPWQISDPILTSVTDRPPLYVDS